MLQRFVDPAVVAAEIERALIVWPQSPRALSRKTMRADWPLLSRLGSFPSGHWKPRAGGRSKKLKGPKPRRAPHSRFGVTKNTFAWDIHEGLFVRKTPNSSLTIVEPPTFTPIAPPRKLGEAGQALWDAVQNEFRIEDCGGIELLMQACLAADRAEALAARIDRDGETIHTTIGLKAHPCLKDELAARSFICRTLQRLGITDEAIRPIGRPPRSFG
jgi:hypothetical protein